MEKNAISILNELSQKKNVPLEYILLPGESGSAEFSYKVTCDMIEGYGQGISKKNAKLEAAKNVLKKLGMFSPESMVVENFPKTNSNMSVNIAAVLEGLASQNGFEPPEFKDLESYGPLNNQIFSVECKLNNYKVVGTGSTKKFAKLSAAEKMLDYYREILPNLNKAMDNSMEVEVDESMSSSITKERVFDSYPNILKNIMKQNNTNYNDLWSGAQNETIDDLEAVLNILQLKYSLTSKLLSDKQIIAFLLINTIPLFVVVEKAETIPKALKICIRKALQLLRAMTS